MTIGPQPPDGLNRKSNGVLTPNLAFELGMGHIGCPHRGTTTCHTCPHAHLIAKLCDYKCWLCTDRHRCPCGQTDALARAEIQSRVPDPTPNPA